MNDLILKFKFWVKASRGYSLPMSLLSFLVVFSWCVKEGGKIPYGLVALLGIAFAHLGTNLFDDFIDFKNNVPKQEAKRTYFQNSNITLKTIFFATFICFFISFVIGIFFIYKVRIEVLYISLFTGLLCALYPKLNHISLGEVALILTFGPNLFYGVSLVMGVDFSLELFIISLLVGILTLILLLAHAFMDFDTDKEVNKKTLLVRLGTKERALNFLFLLLAICYVTLFYLIFAKVISPFGVISIFTLHLVVRLYKYLKDYIVTPDSKLFLRNFIIARNIVSLLDIIISIAILVR